MFKGSYANIVKTVSGPDISMERRNDELSKPFLDHLVTEVCKKKDISGAVFYVSSGDAGIDITSAAGTMKERSQYFIASINKLFISAIVLKLYSENKIDLDDKISKHLPEDVVQGLHIYKGREYSGFLTISHLMSHTSGLPCYLTDKQANGKIAMKELEAGIDQAWPVYKVLQEVKKMKPHFPPGEKSRAEYGDTSYQILSMIIEHITGQPINIVLKNLFLELNLTDTYVYGDTRDNDFVPVCYKSEILDIPLFLASTKNDIISTAKDQMTFLKAFFAGNFFPKDRLNELMKWNAIFFPFQYGLGIEKFSMPRIFSPFSPIPDMIGKCGSTGAVAYFVPDLDIYITGTTNNQAKPDVAFRTMIKIVKKMRQKR